MPEWFIERGIGERRAVLVQDGEIVEARIFLEGATAAGTVLPARLISAGRSAVARDSGGTEYLLPRGSGAATEGAAVRIEVTREAIPGAEPWKRPLARLTNAPLCAPPALEGTELPFPSPGDRLTEFGWDDLMEEARTGVVGFTGGELRVSPTPAMTLIDVDGYLDPEELAVRGAEQSARAIRRLNIGGSIGIDLPTTGSKQARQAAAAALDRTLTKPFERTAINGFGFIQIVRPRQRPSLIELAQDRAAFEARALLRRAALDRAGAKRLTAHPAVTSVLAKRSDWLDRLARQVGGPVELRDDPSLPMSGGYAANI